MSLSGSLRRIGIALCLCGLLTVPACRPKVTGPTVIAVESEQDAEVLGDPTPPPHDASDDFFDNGVIPTLKI